MESKDPSRLVTRWHGFHVNGATKVYFVGPRVRSVLHTCEETLDFNRADKSKEKTITLFQPTHFANPAGYCGLCNVLYVAKEPE